MMAEDTQQIGVTGVSEPMYCGCGCGELVRGRHSVSHSLGGGRYALYLAKHDRIWNDDHPAVVEPAPHFRKIVLPQRLASVESPADKKGSKS